MNVGDIFGIYERPCPSNDNSRVGLELPYYGLIMDVVENKIRTRVYYRCTRSGNIRSFGPWWFKKEEVEIIESVH